MEERLVDLPPFRFWERREGRGTPVVLIHGLGGSADWWKRNIKPLAEEHLVSAVDLVGFGRNRFFLRKSSLPLTFIDMAALLARWMRESFDEPVHLVGNSMGGHIAIHLAAEHPDVVRSLTLVNSTGIPFEIAPGAHLENFIVPRGALSFVGVLARDAFRSGPTSIGIAFARLWRDDARPLLRELKIPVLLLWGERDPLVPPKYARQMQEVIPHSKLEIVPRAGHIPMWENAEAFNRALLTFLGEVERGDVPRGETARFAWGLRGWTNGIAHREAGTRRDIVLVHGLGMSSRYFVHLARALFEDGWNPIAPDLPGFGESVDGPPCDPQEHAEILTKWATELGVRDAVWVGHSIGCNAVVRLPREVCRTAVTIGPLWTKSATPTLRMFGMLALDALREPLALYAYVFPAYWRVGLARWWRTFRRYMPDIRGDAPPAALSLCGERDPLPDRETMNVTEVPGAHACIFSDPEAVARAISQSVILSREDGEGSSTWQELDPSLRSG